MKLAISIFVFACVLSDKSFYSYFYFAPQKSKGYEGIVLFYVIPLKKYVQVSSVVLELLRPYCIEL